MMMEMMMMMLVKVVVVVDQQTKDRDVITAMTHQGFMAMVVAEVMMRQ